MNAQAFKYGVKYLGGRPGLYFRDHEAGRIKVLSHDNKWLATLIPGHLLRKPCDVVLLDIDGDFELWLSWGEAQALLSIWQQEGVNAILEADLDR